MYEIKRLKIGYYCHRTSPFRAFWTSFSNPDVVESPSPVIYDRLNGHLTLPAFTSTGSTRWSKAFSAFVTEIYRFF